MNTFLIWVFCKHCKGHKYKVKSLIPPDYWNFQLPPPLINTNRHLIQHKIKSLCRESNQKLRHTDFYRYIKRTKENYLVIKMKQKFKKSINELWHVPSTNDSFIIMGIPATIKFLSSRRSTFQLHAIKYRIKTSTEKPKRRKLNFTQNIFTRTLKEMYEGISV